MVVSQQRQTVSLWRGAKAAILLLSLVLSADAMAAGIGPSEHPWLGWIVLPPLFVAIRFLGPYKAMACGALWGASVFTFSVTTFRTAVAPTLFSLALLAAIPAIYAYVCARVTRNLGFCALLLAFGWIGVELSLSLLGLHNGLLAGTQGHGVLAEAVGGLFGSVFVAFVIAFVNASVLSILSHMRFRIGPRRLGMGRAERGCALWHLVLSKPGVVLLRACRPRAPPVPGQGTLAGFAAGPG